MKTTMKAAKENLATIGYQIRKVDGEYQTKPNADKWDGASTNYTNDIDDAVATAHAEHRQNVERRNRLIKYALKCAADKP